MNKFNRFFCGFLLSIFFVSTTFLFAVPPVRDANSIGEKVPITGDIEQLKYFFEALDRSSSEKIRIAHYGDSIIWGDVITENLRDDFQNKFGGHGIGFVSACTDDLSARKTIFHEFSDDWEWGSVFTKNRDKLPIGIAGTVGKASSNSTLSYRSKMVSPAASSFSEFSIFYSNTNSNSSMRYKTNGGKEKSVSFSSGSKLNETKIDFGKKIKDIEIELVNCDGAYFYGVTLDSGNGIYIDNFPFRGNSGVSLRDLDDKLLSGFSDNLNYKLFILQFGVNLAASGNVKYQWYERMMLKIIKKIKTHFPETSILFISPGDLGQKQGRTMQTHPEIKKFIAVQEKIAEKGNVAFWNMFEAMGGENSISNWVEAKPPLAFKDYCHLTWEGGEIISAKLVEALMAARAK